MSRLVTFERTVNRTIMQRVYDGEIKKPSITGRAMMNWDKNWHAQGLAGVVDGRSLRDKQGFDALDQNFRRIAEEQFRQFDGRRSAISRNEIELRIRLQLKNEGLEVENLPERLMEEYLSHHWRAIGRTTKRQKSRSLRRVSGHELPAQHPSACCTDISRGDNLIYDPIRDRPVSVEIGSMMSTAIRVVTAMRLFPRSANGSTSACSLRHDARAVDAGRAGSGRTHDRRLALDRRSRVARCERQPPSGLAGAESRSLTSLSGVNTRTRGVTLHGSLRPRLHLRRRVLPLTTRPVRHHAAAQPREEAERQPHLERLHETYQRFYQQSPSFKGRRVYERGSWVGVVADEPMCTAEEYLRAMQRFLTLDYHRQPHDGLVLPGSRGIRLTPLEYWGRPVRRVWAGHDSPSPGSDLSVPAGHLAHPGHAGVEFKNLSYDAEVLEDFGDVRKGLSVNRTARSRSTTTRAT